MDREYLKVKIVEAVDEINSINLLYLILGYINNLKKKEQ